MVNGFVRIMLPVDFSRHCSRATEYAAWFARSCGAAVHLVHVIGNPADALYEPQEVPNWDMVDHAEKKARAMLEESARRCLPEESPLTYHIVHGDPYEKLLDTAKRIEPDLIVVSTHGRSGVAHLIIGSVAERIVRHAPCPVFVVPASRGAD
ncbi:MAG: universal stress protein [Candidatus Binatia bacterium]